MGNMEQQVTTLDVGDLVSRLSIEEKISLLSGKDFWSTRDIPQLGIPSLRMTDGPNGARGSRFFNGVATACTPCGTGLAATWDVELIERAGRLFGRETIAKNAHILLGPTINIQRSPLGGRGFESFSEDPYLSGALAAALVNGIQSMGVAAAIKHFVCNDGEHERQAVNAVVSERALREIYLMPFQIVQRDAKPWTYMTSYNKVNGLHVSENPRLIRDILRKEWGFDGLVMSDWFGTYSATESINAGLDLEMPGPPRVRGTNVRVAVGSRKISEHTINERIENVLNLVNKLAPLGLKDGEPEKEINTPETAQELRQLTAAGLVLLKNESASLPLDKNKSIAVIGPNAKFAAVSGGGSASLKPYYAITPYQGICSYAPDAKYALGATAYDQLPDITQMSKTADGRPGLTANFFNEPPEHKDRVSRDTIYAKESDMFLVDYSHPMIHADPFYMTLEGSITPEETGEYLFGCTVRGTAKVYIDGELVVDNATVQRQGSSYMGAGTPEERGSKVLEAGKTYPVLLQFGSAPTQKVKKKGATAMRGGGVRLGCAKKIDPEEELDRAVALAKEVDQVIICAGLSKEWESEGFDRSTMDLPGRTDDLIRAVAAANPHTVVVVQSGTPVTMPWVDSVPALVQSWYGGNEGGNAIADVLFGAVNPSGKLPLSIPKRLEDNPAFLNFGSENGRTLYGEDVYVGYRYYEKTKTDVLFAFGHGLSYTTFEYSNLSVTGDATTLNIDFEVQNTGSLAGKTVAQVYVSQQKPLIKRPTKELKGFKKVSLEPGQKSHIQIVVPKKYASSYWDEERDMWIMEAGSYDVLVGENSIVTPLAGTYTVEKTSWWSGI